jgi:hypothetical protein
LRVTVSCTAGVPAPPTTSLPDHWATKLVLALIDDTVSVNVPLELTVTLRDCQPRPAVRKDTTTFSPPTAGVFGPERRAGVADR